MDKFKDCRDIENNCDCPDRSISPNCHITCEGYLYRVEQQRKISEIKAKESDFVGFIVSAGKKRYGKDWSHDTT